VQLPVTSKPASLRFFVCSPPSAFRASQLRAFLILSKTSHSGLVDNRPAHAKVIRSKEDDEGRKDLQRTQAYGGTSGPRLFSG
jgi:hypothetical protein